MARRLFGCVVFGTSLFVGGCGVKYACAGLEGGACTTVAEAYAATSDPDWVDPRPAAKTPDAYARVDEAAPQATASVAIDPGAEVKPLLGPPRVLRLWLSHWEDRDHDLHAGGYIFLRVAGSDWVVKQ